MAFITHKKAGLMIKIGEGVECVVYDVGDGTVFKSYTRLHLSYDDKVKYTCVCFELQSIAAEQGLAPKAIRISGTGYYSEKVTPYSHSDGDEWFSDPIAQDLRNAIDQLFGFGWFECRDDNLGILSNGNLCVIDFGLLGFYNTQIGSDLVAKHGVEKY